MRVGLDGPLKQAARNGEEIPATRATQSGTIVVQ
jgi:hypothetical protein